MIANRFSGGWWQGVRRRARRAKAVEYRRARFEVLEPRYALSVSIAPIDPVTLLAGAPLNVAVNATDPSHEVLYYKVLTSNSDVVPTLVDPYYNRSLKISVSYTGDPNTTADDFSGDMVFQLFEKWAPETTARIIELAEHGGTDNTPFYDGLTFHRVIDGFMIQGGDPLGTGMGGSGVTFDDEFTAELQFTSSGILAMANSGSDTNDSQFFITDNATRWLDFKHTIFGFLTKGDDILQKISAVKTDAHDDPPPDEPTNKPKYTVRIDSVSVSIDTENRVLHLAAAAGITGTSTVTVQAIDLDSEGHEQVLATQSVAVTVQTDTNNNRPYLDPEHAVKSTGGTPLDAIEMVAGTSTSFRISAVDVEGDAIYYGASADPDATDITLSVDSSTGVGTLTPASGAVGVRAIAVGVRKPTPDSNDTSPWDTQLVPVYIRPAAPSVSLAADSDTGLASNDKITNLNNTADKKLSFLVTGTVSGAVVEVFADGVVIGSATASGSSTTVQSTGAYTLSDGPHSITAQQTLHNQAVDAGNYQDTVQLISDESAATNIVADTAAPQITSTPVTEAVEGQAYSYPVTTGETDSRQFAMVTAPTGMTVDASTGLITWTPGEVGGSTNAATVRLTDAAGNVTDQSFSVYVEPVNAAPAATEQRVRVMSNASQTITLAGDDGDPDAVQSLAYAIVTGPAHGTISGFNSAAGTLTYTPNADYFGPDSFTFTVTDDAAAGDPASLTSTPATVSIVVTVQNVAPVADAQSVSTAEDTSKSITLTGDDGNTQIDQVLTFQIVQQPAHGTLTGFDPATGQVTYTPAANYNGPDSFTFTVTDDDAAEPPDMVSAAATVSINVTPVNRRPTAASASVTATKNTPRSITLAGSDGDPEIAQTLTFAIVDGPSHGTLSEFDPATGRVTYTPDPNYSGSDSFTFTVTDDDKAGEPAGLTSDAGTIAIQVNAVNAPPTAAPQNAATDEDTPLSMTLTGDDGDPGIDQTLRYAIVSGPSHGKISGFDPSTGAVTYTPNPDFNGSDSFTFTVTDDDTAGPPVNLTSSVAQVLIAVNPVDDAPRFYATSDQSTFQSQTLQFAVQAYDVDIPADTIRFSLEPGSPEGMGIDAATGAITWDVPRSFPTGTTAVAIRATQFNAEGSAGLSSVHSVDIFVQDLGVLAAAALLNNPPGGLGEQTGTEQNSILNGSQTPGPAAAAAGLPLPGSQAIPLPASQPSPPVTDLPSQVNLLNSATLGEHRLGADTGYGGSMVVNPPDSDRQSGQEKTGDKTPGSPENRDSQSPQGPSSAPADKEDRSQPPAGKQGRGSSARPTDVALAALADDAYYMEAAAGEEAVEAAE